MVIYPYNVFYLIDLDQSVNKSREPLGLSVEISYPLVVILLIQSRLLVVYEMYILLRASELWSPTIHPRLWAATRHRVRDPLVRSQVD